jgi:Domain of unknown function (DUF4389)/Domain of unknown function (DUF4352)
VDTQTAAGIESSNYPLLIRIPRCDQHRRTALARPLLALPAVVFSVLLNVGAMLAVWAAALATGRVPGWLFDFQLSVMRWHTRTVAYLLLLTGSHPPLDGVHPIICELAAPGNVARRKVIIWKLITAFPHLVALTVLTVALIPVWCVGWIAVAVTGHLPTAGREYSGGVLAWWARVGVYIQSLTDEFPPFSLHTRPRRARRGTYVASAAVGLVPTTLMVAFATYIIGFSGTHVTVDVPYAQLQTGSITSTSTARVESGLMTLLDASDHANDSLSLLTPHDGQRFVAFTISIHNWRGAGETVPVSPPAFRLTTDGGSTTDAVMVAVDGTPGSRAVASGRTGIAAVVFEIPTDARPTQLTWDILDYISFPRRGETVDWNLT